LNIRRLARSFALLMACLGILLPAVCAAEVIAPTDSFYVNDQSEILSEETTAYILDTAGSLDDQTGVQICVVTVDFIGGANIADYAYELFNDWGIGSSEKNNGLLLLVVIGEENYYLLQGKGLESVLPSGTLQTILDRDMEPDFAAENYDAGVRKTYDSLLAALCSHYGVNAGADQSGALSGSSVQTRPAVTTRDYDAPGEYRPDYGHDSDHVSSIGAGIRFLGFGVLIVVLVIFGLVIGVIVLAVSSVSRTIGRGIGNAVGGRRYDPYRNLHRRVPPPPGGFGGIGGFGHRPGHMGGFGGPRPGGFNSRTSNRSGGFSSRSGGGFSSRSGSGRSGGFSGGSRGGRSGGGGSSRGGGAGRR